MTILYCLVTGFYRGAVVTPQISQKGTDMKLATAEECRKLAEDFAKHIPVYQRISDELITRASLGDLTTVLSFDCAEERKHAKKCVSALGFDIIGHGIINAIGAGENDIYTLEVSWKK